MAIPHRPLALSSLWLDSVSGQFVIAQKFIPHCPTPKRRRCANGSDVGLLFVLAKYNFWLLTELVAIRDFQLKKYRIPRGAEGVKVVLSP